MIEELLKLQEKIFAYHSPEEDVTDLPRVHFAKIGDFFEITFYGEGGDEDPDIHSSEFVPDDEEYEYDSYYAFYALQDLLIEYPDEILSLSFSGPDIGANGVKGWDFSRLIQSGVVFRNLKSFRVSRSDVGDHNISIIGSDIDNIDAEMIARLVSMMPSLEELELPSAPGKSFFDLSELKITFLAVQSIFQDDFVENLADSSNLPLLSRLDYTAPISNDNDKAEKTYFESYKKLFASKLLASRFHFKLRENSLSQTQLKELKSMQKTVMLLHIKTVQAEYVYS